MRGLEPPPGSPGSWRAVREGVGKWLGSKVSSVRQRTSPLLSVSTLADVWALIGHSGIEGELQFREVTSRLTAETGDRPAVADVNRAYACPVCGKRGKLPPEAELRRLAKEQGYPDR
jgi:hypothetical protein